MRDESINDSIINEMNEINQDLENGIKIESFGVYNKVWDDENSLIFYTTAKSVVNNKDIIEVITASVLLYKQYGVYNYIYENYGEDKPLKNAQLLLNAAKSTKSR